MADAGELIQQSLMTDAADTTSPNQGAGYLAAAAEDAGVSQENMSPEMQVAQMSPLEIAANFGDNAHAYMNDMGAFDYYRDSDRDRSLWDASADSARGFVSGAVGGLIDTAAFGTGLVSNKAGKALSETSKDFRDWLSSYDSDAAKARRRALQARKEAADIELEAEYQRDVANGANSTIAALRREGKGLLRGLTQDLTDSVGLSDIISQGAGSLVTSGGAAVAIKKGAIKAGKLIAKAGNPHAGTSLARAGQKYGWYGAAGAVEGGGTYTDTFNEVLDTSIQDLYQNSPEFASLVQQYMTEGMSQKDAEQQARIDLGAKAATVAGLIQGAAATGLAKFSKGMEGIVTKPLKARSAASAGADVLGEGIEEAGTGATGQVAQNIVNKAYVDKDQELLEGVGRATGESFIGGIGAAGVTAGPGIARHGYNKAKETIKNKLASFEKETADNSAVSIVRKETEDTIDSILKGNTLASTIDTATASTSNTETAEIKPITATGSDTEVKNQEPLSIEGVVQKVEESLPEQPKVTVEPSVAEENTVEPEAETEVETPKLDVSKLSDEDKKTLIQKQEENVSLLSTTPVQDVHPDVNGKNVLSAYFKLPNLILDSKDPVEKKKLLDSFVTLDDVISSALDPNVVNLTEEGSQVRKIRKAVDMLQEEVNKNQEAFLKGISTLEVRHSPEEAINLSNKGTAKLFIAKYVSGNLKEDDLRDAMSAKDFNKQISKLNARDQKILKGIKAIQDLEGVTDKFKGFKKADGSKSADDVHKDLTTGHDAYFKSRHDLAKDYITSLILGSKEEQMSNLQDIGSFMKSQERKIKAFDKSFKTGKAAKYQSAESSVGEKQAVVHKHNKNSMDLYATVYEDYLLTKALYDNLLDATRDNFTKEELAELNQAYNTNTFQATGLQKYAKEIEGIKSSLGLDKRRVRTATDNAPQQNQGKKDTNQSKEPVKQQPTQGNQPVQSTQPQTQQDTGNNPPVEAYEEIATQTDTSKTETKAETKNQEETTTKVEEKATDTEVAEDVAVDEQTEAEATGVITDMSAPVSKGYTLVQKEDGTLIEERISPENSPTFKKLREAGVKEQFLKTVKPKGTSTLARIGSLFGQVRHFPEQAIGVYKGTTKQDKALEKELKDPNVRAALENLFNKKDDFYKLLDEYMEFRADDLNNDNGKVKATKQRENLDNEDFKASTLNRLFLIAGKDGKLPEQVKEAIFLATLNTVLVKNNVAWNQNLFDEPTTNVWTYVHGGKNNGKVLRGRGYLANEFYSDIGKNTMRYLDLAFTKDALIPNRQGLETAIGMAAMYAYMQQDIHSNAEPKDRSLIYYYQLKSDVQAKNSYQATKKFNIDQINNDSVPYISIDLGQSGEVLREHRNIISQLVLNDFDNPVYMNQKPPVVKDAKKVPMGLGKRLTEDGLKAVNNLQDIPYRFDRTIVDFWEKLGKEGACKLLGCYITEDMRKYANENHLMTLDGQAETFIQGIEETHRMIQFALNSEVDPYAADFYFPNSMLKQGRIMQEGTATYVSNKMLRSMISPTWSTLDLNNPEHMQVYGLAMAQIFGIRVQDLGEAESLKRVRDLISRKEFQALVKNIQAWQANKNAPLDPLKIGGTMKALGIDMSPMAVQYIVDYAQMQTAIKQGATTYTTSINFEPDGVNNGPANLQCILCATEFTDTNMIGMAQTGNTFGAGPQSKHDVIEAADRLGIPDLKNDMYTQGRNYLQEALDTNVDPEDKLTKATLSLLRWFGGSGWKVKDGRWEITRAAVKPFMRTHVYGSGAGSKLGNVLHQLADGCNEFMTWVSYYQTQGNNLNTAFELASKKFGIEGLTPVTLKETLRHFWYDIKFTKDFAKEFDLMRIEKEFKESNTRPGWNEKTKKHSVRLGTVFQNVADRVYGKRLMDNFRQYNNAMNLGSYVFMEAFRSALGDLARKKAQQELGVGDPKIGRRRQDIIDNWEFSEKDYDDAIREIWDTVPLIDCGTYKYLALKESFYPEYGETFVDQNTKFNTTQRQDVYPVMPNADNANHTISIMSEILQMICPGISTAPNSVIGNGDGKMMAYAFGRAIMKKAANTYDGGQCDIVDARKKTKLFNECGYAAVIDPQSNVYRAAAEYMGKLNSKLQTKDKLLKDAVDQFVRDYQRNYNKKAEDAFTKEAWIYSSSSKKLVTPVERIRELREAYKNKHHREYNPATTDELIYKADRYDDIVKEMNRVVSNCHARFKMPVFAGDFLPKADFFDTLAYGKNPTFPTKEQIVECFGKTFVRLQRTNQLLADNMDARQYAIQQVGMSFGNMCGFNADSSFYSKEGVAQGSLDITRAQNSLNYLASKFLVEERGWGLQEFREVWTSDPRVDYGKDALFSEVAKDYAPVTVENNLLDVEEENVFRFPDVGSLPLIAQEKLHRATPTKDSPVGGVEDIYNLLTKEGLFKEMRYFINKMAGNDLIKNVTVIHYNNAEEFNKLKSQYGIEHVVFNDKQVGLLTWNRKGEPIIIMNGNTLETNKNQYYRTLMHELGHACMSEAIMKAHVGVNDKAKKAYDQLQADAREFLEWANNPDTAQELDNILAGYDEELVNSFKRTLASLNAMEDGYVFVDEFVQNALAHPIFTQILNDQNNSLNSKRTKSLAGWFGRLLKSLWEAVFSSELPKDFIRAGTLFTRTFYNAGRVVRHTKEDNVQPILNIGVRNSPEVDTRVSQVGSKYKEAVKFFNDMPISKNEKGAKFILAKGNAELSFEHASNMFKIDPEARTAYETTYMLIANNTRNQGTSLPMATELYRHIVKNVKPDTMFKGNPDISREKYRALFNMDKAANDTVAQFTAIAMTCPEVMDTLNKLPPLPKEESFADTWFDRKVEDLANAGMTVLQNLVTKDSGKRGLGDQFLYHSMRVMFNKDVTEGSWYNKPHMLLEKGDSYIANMMNKAGSKVAETVLSKSSSEFAKNLLNSPDSVAVAVRKTINGANATKTSLGFRQFFGAQSDSWHLEDMIKKLATRASRTRTICRTMIPSFLEKNFKRSFTKEEKAMLTRTVLKTDLSCLTKAGYFNETLSRMLLDDHLMKEHQDMHAEHFNAWQIKKAKQLAQYLVDGKVTPNLLRNAQAIACEVGTDRYNHETPASVISRMDNLITLYALDRLSKQDKEDLSKFLGDSSKTAEDARQVLYGALFNNKEDEAKKAKESYMGRFNQWKGYAPAAVRGTRKLHVLPMKDRAKYEAVGYTFKKKVTDPFHPHKEYGYFFAPMDPSGAFIQGSVSITHQTAGGINVGTGKSTENVAFYTNREGDLLRYLNGKVNTSNMVPVYNKFGKIVAIEQRMDQDMLDLLDKEQDIFKLVGDHRGRITEEASAMGDVSELLEVMHDQYIHGSKDEYVNLYDAKDLPNSIQKAWELVPYEVKQKAQKLFGKNTFMVRKDQLEDILGHRQASVTDMWLGNSNWTPANQARFRKVMETIMGKNAAKYLLYGERTAMTAAAWARNAIVVKSMVVPGINIACNVFQLMGRGVPLTYIASRVPALVAQTANYTKYEQSILRNKILMNSMRKQSDKYKYQTMINSLEAMQAKMGTIHTLVQAGEFNTIADIGTLPEDVDLLSGKMENYITKVVDKLPESVKITGENILLTKNTSLYKGLEKSVQYGDFIAKAILYEYEMNHGTKSEDALHLVREEFVNYDYSMGRSREYLENIGLMWFYNYKIRIMKSALRAIKDKPLFGVIGLMTGGPTMLGTLELPIEACLFAKALGGGLWRSVGPEMGMDAWEKIPLINILT